MILFCNLIGDARFQASDVNGLTPQYYQSLSYHVLGRGNELEYEEVSLTVSQEMEPAAAQFNVQGSRTTSNNQVKFQTLRPHMPLY